MRVLNPLLSILKGTIPKCANVEIESEICILATKPIFPLDPRELIQFFFHLYTDSVYTGKWQRSVL